MLKSRSIFIEKTVKSNVSKLKIILALLGTNGKPRNLDGRLHSVEYAGLKSVEAGNY